MIRAVQRQVVFVGKFLRSPRQIGAITPSSPFLAREIVHLAQVRQSKTIVEFGPGTGAFTKEILAQMPRDARLLAVEADAGMALLLRKKFHRAIITAGSAQKIRRIMKAHQLEAADCIISGLPWASFEPQLQDDILEEALAVLKPGGKFASFGYIHALGMPGAKRFREQLHHIFGSVQMSKVIWKNVPPAMIYCCTKEK
ncbi:MAG: methyltransferase domain-containing protein [Planctomycetales bacterium]|nr:methyltransferase domain-containing protein [Planctomycetales bacterium]